MSNLNIVVGLSGVGKSTLLEKTMQMSEEKYKIINYGDKMFEIAKNKGYVETRDEMKKLETKKFKQLQKKAAKNIFEHSKDKNVILDTHSAIKSPYGYVPGLPRWSIRELKPDKIIMITADPEEIYERSKTDEDRERQHESVDKLREYQDVAKSMASADAVETGAYFKIIKNKQGEIENAAENLLKTLEA